MVTLNFPLLVEREFSKFSRCEECCLKTATPEVERGGYPLGLLALKHVEGGWESNTFEVGRLGSCDHHRLEAVIYFKPFSQAGFTKIVNSLTTSPERIRT
jgi:hypothetical protein